MQKWEYLEINVMYEKDIPYPYALNGQQIRDWKKGPNIFDYLNQLGDQGWELVVPMYGSALRPGGYILKRAK